MGEKISTHMNVQILVGEIHSEDWRNVILPQNHMFPIGIYFSRSLFSWAMLVSGSVHCTKLWDHVGPTIFDNRTYPIL